MADELFKVRKDFVGSMTEEVINQLLDDLFSDHILNHLEKDSVLQENRSIANRARILIDTVMKKGDVASRKMIAHLQSNDPTLSAKLGLGPAAEPRKEQEQSTTEEFRKKKQNNTDIYPVTKDSMRNRVALLITNIKFTDETFNRDGAEKDEENMEKLLGSLGYEVVKHTNLTGKAIDAAIIKFSKHPKLEATDSVVVVIMSHGKLGAVLGVDCKNETSGVEEQDEFPISDIFKHLGSEKCPALLNKPKIIIIQACRGEEGGAVLVSHGANAAVVCDDVKQPGPSPSAGKGNIKDDVLGRVHKEKDFISLLSSTPDTVSYRDTDHGSFLIQYIVDVLNTFAHEDDIEELFRKVMLRFEDLSIDDDMQMPTKERCTLTKRFYFPGI